MTSGTAWSGETVAAALQAYQCGESACSISRRLGCSATAIYEWLDDAGIPRIKYRPKSGEGSPNLPEHVLSPDWLSTEAGAWALGMHVTDGCLRRPAGRPGQSPSLTMRVALRADDRGGLNRLAQAYGVDPARVRTVGDLVVFDFSHPRLSFLEEIGQPVGKKAGRAALPENLTSSPHAWRGVLDGDGYVTLLSPAGRRPQLHVGLRASGVRLREQFADAARAMLGSERGVCLHRRGVTVTNLAALRLIGHLYRTAHYSIPRKRAKALRLAVEYGNAVTPPAAEVIVSALVEAITGEGQEPG